MFYVVVGVCIVARTNVTNRRYYRENNRDVTYKIFWNGLIFLGCFVVVFVIDERFI